MASGSNRNSDVSIFQDASFLALGPVSDTGGDDNGRSLGLFKCDKNVHSVKARMKQSLARRRTALRARNIDVLSEKEAKKE